MSKFEKPQFAYTISETAFHLAFPRLQQQVTFGTGKNGLKKWGSKKYVADFYWPKKKIVFEIDGKSHETEYRQVCDRLRDLFFEKKLGIKTVRISNSYAKKIFWDMEKRQAKQHEKRNQQIFNSIFG